MIDWVGVNEFINSRLRRAQSTFFPPTDEEKGGGVLLARFDATVGLLLSSPLHSDWGERRKGRLEQFFLDVSVLYYLARNSLVALLEALCARKSECDCLEMARVDVDDSFV